MDQVQKIMHSILADGYDPSEPVRVLFDPNSEVIQPLSVGLVLGYTRILSLWGIIVATLKVIDQESDFDSLSASAQTMASVLQSFQTVAATFTPMQKRDLAFAQLSAPGQDSLMSVSEVDTLDCE
jgi:hypothetical protein